MTRALNGLMESTQKRHDDPERDVVALGIAIAAIILFVATGGTVLPQIVRAWSGDGAPPDVLLINAVLLNIALLLFGWRRYRDLQLEVERRRDAEERARALAERDPLTGCLNRRSGPAAIEMLSASLKGTHREIAALMIDIDNFKQINDLNGHKHGDKVLTTIAERLIDSLPPDAVLARIGGDEFACALAYDREDRGSIDDLVDLLIGQISTPIDCGQSYVEATVSIGVSAWEDEDGPVDPDILIHRADIAMYQAKKRGRNRHYWFEPHMESELRLRNELESAIRQGVANGEFVPYYEQQIDLETGRIVGFEMLARWINPRYGVVSPEIFIPIAEEIDQISELSEGLIRQALQDAKAWDASLTLSVNISPFQLRDRWFAQKLLQLLVENNFPPGRLEIEITESCLHENLGSVRSIISSLKNQGIRISLDDFGTGYSSLTQLRALPFDRLKIDRSFVTDLTGESDNLKLIEGIVSLSRGLALPITAEGIENAGVLDRLKGLGELTDLGEMKGQGYHYGMPEDAEATKRRLAKLGLLATSDRVTSPRAVEEVPATTLASRKAV